MSNIINKFRITDGKDFSLHHHKTDWCGDYKKEESEELLLELIDKTAGLQSALYADNNYAVLIIFQAMDAGGKDSAIKHTLSGLNPQGCNVFSFKQPSAEELAHDFLWRHFKTLPQYGRIGVYNRSHYENVLVSKVHPDLLVKEHLPGIKSGKDVNKKFWENRYESIRDFEKHLTVNRTVVIKFFLHISPEEQKDRFLKRIEDPAKNWKFSAADVYEREYWAEYMKAYEKAIKETATESCPWYVIPADKKWFARVAISTIILDTLKKLKLEYPELPASEKEKLAEAKRKLLKE